jgi:hypothetical protein
MIMTRMKRARKDGQPVEFLINEVVLFMFLLLIVLLLGVTEDQFLGGSVDLEPDAHFLKT